MAMRITGDLAITAGTAPRDVEIGYRDFLMVNASTTGTVYFREKGTDGIDAAKGRGFALWPGETNRLPMTADVLSLVADEGTVDVRMLFLDY